MLIAEKGGTTLASTTSSQEELNSALGVTAEETSITPSAAAAEEEEGAKAETGSESETETTEESEERQQQPQHKGGWQRKIDKLTKRNTQIAEALEEERLARQRLEAQLAGRQPATAQPVKPAEDQEPSEEGVNPKTGKPWTDWKEFSKAHAQWAYKQAAKEQSEVHAEHTANEEQKKTWDAHLERLNAAKSRHDDWDEVAKGLVADEVGIPQAVGLALIEEENGPEILYFLAKNPEVLKKLQGMSEVRAVTEIGRIAASLPAASKPNEGSPPAKPQSSAPAPIKPVGGSNATTVPDPMKLPLSEYIKRRNKGDAR